MTPSLGSDRTLTELVRGTAASGGVKEGCVAVIHSIEDAISRFDTLSSDTVLVLADGGPDWTPVLLRAGAIVTDMGGVLSHPAIVARQEGIPCVVGTRIGTSVLKEGMLVLVDGGQGRIFSVR